MGMEGKQITYLGLQQVVHGTRTVCAFPWSFMLGCCKEKMLNLILLQLERSILLSKGQPSPRADIPTSVILLQRAILKVFNRGQPFPRADTPTSVTFLQLHILISVSSRQPSIRANILISVILSQVLIFLVVIILLM